jgi:hypothetical protein
MTRGYSASVGVLRQLGVRRQRTKVYVEWLDGGGQNRRVGIVRSKEG